MAWLLALLGPLGDFIVKLLKGLGPKPEVIEAEKAGSAQAQVQILEASNEEIRQAADAGAAVDKRIATDDGVRDYAKTDPNNRDNAGKT